MIRRPPRSTRTDTLCPYTTLFRSLQHAVRRKTNAGYDAGWRERRLFDFREVVFRVAVQFQHTDLDQRIVLVRPDLGQVDRIPAGRFREGVSLGLGHLLYAELPLRSDDRRVGTEGVSPLSSRCA